MKVNEIFIKKNRKVITATAEMTLQQAMKLLIENKISSLPIIDENDELIGIVSDKDIFVSLYSDTSNMTEKTVKEIMSVDLIVGIESDDLNYVAGLMTNNKIRHIPIVDKNKIIGMISVGDIVKAQMTNIEIENRYLKNYIDGNYPG
ncbi:MAG: CBS domain-containing protein [candidate division Zixibacteria bacterium]|nr:CBS domain-containing protein [candidate division Zixibacteria bacterium]